MTISKKELILTAIENTLKSIIKGNAEPKSGYVYENTVSYVDRQYLVFDMDMVEKSPKPWIILNNNGENIGNLPGKKFDNTILTDIIGFISADDSNPNLDTLMNSLQKDIIVAMLSNENLSGLCAYIVLRTIETVPEMVYPHGGFAISMEIVYNVTGIDF